MPCHLSEIEEAKNQAYNTGTLSSMSNHHNSFDDRAPVDVLVHNP